MRIPKEFMLYGKRVHVSKNNKLIATHNWTGLASYEDNVIQIQWDTPNYPVARDNLEQTFCHEMVHHILNAADYQELRGDEQFVERFSCLLHQALTSMKGEIK